MAYTTPRTWVAGEIVDKDMMNEQVRDNIAYLKNLADDNKTDIGTINNTTLKSAPFTRLNYYNTSGVFTKQREANISYQNTSGKLRMIFMSVIISAGSQQDFGVYLSASSMSPPPSRANCIAYFEFPVPVGYYPCTFIVPPGYYVMVHLGNTDNMHIGTWTEYDLF